MVKDMELIVGTDDYEGIQYYFEGRKNSYYTTFKNMSERLLLERKIDTMEEIDEEDKISDRCKAIRRILGLLQEVPSDCKESPFSKTESKK